jgi:hypothetical protein
MKRGLISLVLILVAGAASAETPPTKIDSEATAKAAIQAKGYKAVSSLRMGADGTWSGSAMRENQQVAVTVDAEGQVTQAQR